ncbi:MAG: DUF4339 domain-containing protein [Chitinophagaceae bacterium]|nr:MAG: DUF4339 domain-containing protein [Chitinophagaceae bacterium]
MNAYFLHDGLNHSGPYSLQELQDKPIVPDTPVWTETIGDWSTAKELPELAAYVGIAGNRVPAGSQE